MCGSAAALRSRWWSSFAPPSLPWRSVTCDPRKRMPTCGSSDAAPISEEVERVLEHVRQNIGQAACARSRSPEFWIHRLYQSRRGEP